MRWFYLAVVILLVAVAVIFAAQNFQVIDVSFLGVHLRVRLVFLIAAIYALGAVTGAGFLALIRRSYEGAGIFK